MHMFRYLLIGLLSAFTMMACVDRDFDETPAAGEVDPMIPADLIMTIGELKAYYQEGQFVQIPDDKFVRGIVNADDQAGNIFKSLILQDSVSYTTDNVAGITFIVDVNEMHREFFAGREVFVKVKDLFISDFAGLVQVGYGPDNDGDMIRIPQSVADEILVAGLYRGEPVPTPVSIGDLDGSYQSVLIQLDDVEVVGQQLGTTWGDVQAERTSNTSITDCEGREVVVRGSAFSDFAGTEVPAGNGSIVAVYGEFNGTSQLTFRDLMDLDMNGTRCDGSSGSSNKFFDEDGNFIGDADKVISIADFKAQYFVQDRATLIEDDIILRGQVVSSDETGNFFKDLIFQDETAGIKIRIDADDLYLGYPLGADVAVSLQGLSIGAFNGLIQLGIGAGSDVDRLPEDQYRSFVFAGQVKSQPTPIDVRIADLDDSYQNRLIRLLEVETASANPGTYADGVNRFSFNIDIQDCDGSTIIMRNSGFASFADELLPSDNGELTGVYGVFNEDKQVFIRDTDDVDFDGDRCDDGGTVIDPNEFFDDNGNFIGDINKVISIADFKSQYFVQDQATTIEDDIILRGQVISSDETGNFFKDLIFQDETAGIKIRIDAFDLHLEYPLGADIAVPLQGLSIGAFNGLIQLGVGSGSDIDRVPESQYKNFVFAGQVQSGPSPIDVSIADLDDSYQNRLIRLSDVETASANPGTYADGVNQVSFNVDIQDCDGETIVMRNSGFASFADQTMPSGNGELIAVYGVFGETKQVFIRDTDDVRFNGARCDGGGGDPMGDAFPEDFTSTQEFLTPWDADGWLNFAVSGDRVWLWRDFEDNGFVEARGFQEAQSTIDTWLITPEIDLNESSSISFITATAFWTHDALTVWVSPTFDDPADANWTLLSPDLAGQSDANYDWVESGDVMLPGSGLVRVGFRHQGDNTTNTGTYRIDDVAIK